MRLLNSYQYYPKPRAIYSLRYFPRTEYAGDVILVRRGSDNAESGFNPSEISDGTLATFCGASDGFIKTWYDQSGNGLDATQETTTYQPKIYYSATGLVTDGGQPAIQFAPAPRDYLRSPNLGLTWVGSSDNTPGSNHSFFLVFTPNGSVEFNSVLSFSSGTNQNPATILEYNPTILPGSFTYGGRNAVWQVASVQVVGQRNLVSVVQYGINAVGYFLNTYANGQVNGETGNVGWVDITGNISIGARHDNALPFIGFMQELVIFDSALMSSRVLVEDDINSYYGIY